jgi:hypothetical protein
MLFINNNPRIYVPFSNSTGTYLTRRNYVSYSSVSWSKYIDDIQYVALYRSRQACIDIAKRYFASHDMTGILMDELIKYLTVAGVHFQ